MHKEVSKILEMVTLGKSNKEIASVLNFSEAYIKKLISKLFKQYKVSNRTALASEYIAQRMHNL